MIKKWLIALVLLNLVACDKIKDKVTEMTDKFSEKQSPVEALDPPKPSAPKVVAWLVLENGSSGGRRLLSGQVSSAERTNLSFESSGKVKSIKVKLGDRFKKGQRLATLDTTNYKLQLRQAKAAYATAVANRDQAAKEVKRFERLVRAKAAPAIQLDNYRLQLSTAQESINNAQAQIELAEKQLADTALIAPFSGVVTAQLGEVGQLASPQVPIFTVEADGVPEVSLAVPENMISMIKPKQQVIVTIPSQPTIGGISATVSEIATQATYGAFPITLVLNSPPKRVKPGMTAEVAFSMPQSIGGGFRIPPSALGAGADNTHFVYRIVATDDNAMTLEKIPVQIEALADESIVIRGHLETGDKIVRTGWSFLTPGQQVTLMGEGAQTVNP